jgi:hypothetical protein
MRIKIASKKFAYKNFINKKPTASYCHKAEMLCQRQLP